MLNLLSARLGFNPANVVIAGLTLQNQGAGKSSFPAWSNLLEQVRSFPGLDYASLSSAALFGAAPRLMGVRTAVTSSSADPLTGLAFVSDGYFSTLGIGFISGRDFQDFDESPHAPAVAIVNQAFARKFFGAEIPLGHKLTKLANAPAWTEIVGIVRDVKVNSVREIAPPMLYIPYARSADWTPPEGLPGVSFFLEVRGQQDLGSLATTLRQTLGSRFTVDTISRQQQLITDTLVRERLLANVAGLFGGLALLLAGLGVYGIVSYPVVQRRQELGVRMALGADAGAILTLILRDAAAVVGAGMLLGLIVSVLASRWVGALLYGLAPNDTGTIFAACLVLLAVSLLAAFIPAYRAVKVDPLMALRHE
jgi:predicted permease